MARAYHLPPSERSTDREGWEFSMVVINGAIRERRGPTRLLDRFGGILSGLVPAWIVWSSCTNADHLLAAIEDGHWIPVKKFSNKI